MKIKIQPKMKLGIHEYTVVYNPRLFHEEGMKGTCNHITQQIQIDPMLAPSQQVVTFLHEVKHIINDIFRCKLDEDEIERMAQGDADFLVNVLGIEFDWSLIRTI